jgi:hypothetical protein
LSGWLCLPQNQPRCFEKSGNLFPMSGIESWFLDHPTHDLFTEDSEVMPTQSLWLLTVLFLDDRLTVHHSITLVNFQLDAQNSYLFICNTFIKILYMFQALPSSSSGGLHRNCTYAASCIVSLCGRLSCAPVNKEQDSHLQRVTIPEAAYIQLRCRPPENEQGNAWNM